MASIIKVDQIQTAAGGTPTATDLGINTSGNVLQVVSFDTTTDSSSTSLSYSATNITASITPSSTSSKILVLVCYNGGPYRNNGSEARGDIGLSRDGGSTMLNEHQVRYYDYGGSGIIAWSVQSFQYLDSPNTTGQLTYTVYHRMSDAGTTAMVQSNGGSSSTITLLEIAG